MQNFFQRFFKKRYIFIGIVVLAVIGLLGSVMLASLNSARRKSSSLNPLSSGGITAPLKSPSLSFPFVSDFASAPSGQVGESRQSGTAQAQEGQLTQRKIIKNGSLSLLVEKVEAAVANIQSLAKTFSGFVGDSRIYETSSGTKSGTITIRVPADRFEETLAEIKKMAAKVENESVTAQDVTEQFVDFEARLRNFQAQETQYLEIMKRAFTVAEILQVQQRLGEVRGQIEQIQGQIQYLSRQIDMSTIMVSLSSKADVEIFGIYWRPFAVVKQSLHTMFSGLVSYADLMIGFILRLPVILAWLATIVFFLIVAWRIFRWIKTKFFSPRPPVQQN